jgi:hypothetical protein
LHLLLLQLFSKLVVAAFLKLLLQQQLQLAVVAVLECILQVDVSSATFAYVQQGVLARQGLQPLALTTLCAWGLVEFDGKAATW